MKHPVVPPVPRQFRATRKPVLYRYLECWNEPGLGLDPFEWGHLDRLGYGRWLRRGRLTEGMTVALIFYTLDLLDYLAADRAVHRADIRSRTIQSLQRRRARPARDEQPAGLTNDEVGLLKALEQLERAVNALGGPHFTTDNQGRTTPLTEPKEIRSAEAAIDGRWPELTSSVRSEVTRQLTSERRPRLGNGRNAPVIHLGERPGYTAEAAALRRELGDEFLDHCASPRYRATRVRKWKQLALARAERAAHRERRRGDASPSQRALIRARRGIDRQAIELRVVRSCVELASDDPRKAAREARFVELSAKHARRAAYLRMFMEAIRNAAETCE